MDEIALKLKEREKRIKANAEIARELLNDNRYIILKKLLSDLSEAADEALNRVLRKANTTEDIIDARVLAFKKTFYTNFKDTAEDWLEAERGLEHEKKVSKEMEKMT